MGFEEAVVGGRQPEVLHPSRHDPRQQPGEPVLEAERQPRHRLDDLIDRAAERVLGNHPGTAAGRDEDSLGDPLSRKLRHDVDAAVADPDHDHALTPQVERLGRIDVVMRVQGRPVEVTGELGQRRIPVVAVADQQRLELVRLAVVGVDQPATSVPGLGALHHGLEADPLAQREAVGVLAQELVDLRMVREVRVALVHREVGEADRAALRCRCAASDRPTSGRWGCGSTSCRRRHRWLRSTCTGRPSRAATCRLPAR